MKTLSTAANTAIDNLRPVGSRITTNAHMLTEKHARAFQPEPDFNKFEVIHLLKEVGLKLPENEYGLRWTHKLITHLEFLIARTQDRDWHQGKPIVWYSVKMTADALGYTAIGQINKNENMLMRLGAISWNDSANHKRYGHRDAKGNITTACGVNLAPVGTLLQMLRAERIRMRSQPRLSDMESIMTEIRKKCAGHLNYFKSIGLADDNVIAFQQKYTAIANEITSYRRKTIEQINGWIQALREWLAEMESWRNNTKDPTDATADASMGVFPAAPTTPVDNPQDSGVNEQKKMPKPCKKETPAMPESDAHTIQTNENSLKKNTSRDGPVDNLPPPVANERPSVYCPEGRSSRGDGLADNGDALPPTPAEIPPPVSTPPWLNPTMFYDKLPDSLARHIPRNSAVVETNHIIAAAKQMRPRLSISEDAWNQAIKTAGETAAAIIVFIVAWKWERGEIYNPGGYMRGMIRKGRRGELNLLRSLYGLQKSDPSPTRRKGI